MRVPNYIKVKMHRIATLQKQAASLSAEVDNWFIEHGLILKNFAVVMASHSKSLIMEMMLLMSFAIVLLPVSLEGHE